MPQKMDGTDWQTMDQLGLWWGLDSNTMDFIELNIGKNNTSNPNKGKLAFTNEIITSKPKKGRLTFQ